MNITNKTLLLLGFPRTGTTTLWTFLNKHPKILSTKEKEPLQLYQNINLGEKQYLKHWSKEKIEYGDVLVDGTPMWWIMQPELFKTISFNKVCCLFSIRRPYINWYRSFLYLNYYLAVEKAFTNNFIDKNGYINLSVLKQSIKLGFRHELTRIENIIGNENILVIDFDQLESQQKIIYDFLGVDNNYYNKIDHLNKAKDNIWSLPGGKNIHLVISYMSEYIQQVEKEDIEYIKKHYSRGFL